MVSIAVLINIPVVMACFLYGAYCMFHGGFHMKGKGWRTKQENPRTFYFTLILMYFIGLFTLATTLFPNWFAILR